MSPEKLHSRKGKENDVHQEKNFADTLIPYPRSSYLFTTTVRAQFRFAYDSILY